MRLPATVLGLMRVSLLRRAVPLLAAMLMGAGGAARAQEPAQTQPGPGVPRTQAPGEPTAPDEARPGTETAPESAPTGSGDRNGWRFIVIHHSASAGGNQAQFDRMHKRKGWDGVAYHFVIDNGKGGADGHLEVSPRWWGQKHGAHAGALPAGVLADERNEYNEFGIGICLVGNLEQRPPTRKQMETLVKLVAHLREMFQIPEESILGHRHVKCTACPGRYFPWQGLFAQLQLPPPEHLFRHVPTATVERCPWCLQHERVALGRRTPPPVLPPVDLPPPGDTIRTPGVTLDPSVVPAAGQ